MRVAVIDSQPVVRAGLRLVIDACTSLSFAFEASDPREAMEKIRAGGVDLVVSEVAFQDHESVFELLRELRELPRPVPLLVFSHHLEQQVAPKALQAGARGYLEKHASMEEIVRAMHRVLAGKVYLSREMTEWALDHLTPGGTTPQTPATQVSGLTVRELEILELIGSGMQSKEIANCLHISLKTVETHRAHLREKLGIASGSGLVCYASQWVVTEHAAS